MSKQLKADKRRQECSPKRANYRRKERRKAAKARLREKIEYMKGWADRAPAPVVWR